MKENYFQHLFDKKKSIFLNNFSYYKIIYLNIYIFLPVYHLLRYFSPSISPQSLVRIINFFLTCIDMYKLLTYLIKHGN